MCHDLGLVNDCAASYVGLGGYSGYFSVFFKNLFKKMPKGIIPLIIPLRPYLGLNFQPTGIARGQLPYMFARPPPNLL